MIPFMTPGEYNKGASLQGLAMQPSIPFLAQAAESVPLAPGKPVVVADLGASHGINSIQPVKAILAALAARTPAGQTQEVAVYHEDLPSNDFASLIALIQDPEKSYLPPPPAQQQQGTQQGGSGAVAVYPYLIARSFYEGLFPSSSVHITFAFTTLHFLSVRPLGNHFTLFAHVNPDPEFRAAFAAQARSDLTSFLELRAAETVPGGALVAHFPVLKPEGGDGGRQWGMGMHFLEQVVQEHLRDGKLSPEELAKMSSYAYFLSPKEIMDVVHSVKQLWTVKESFVRPVEEPLAAQLAAGEVTPEAAADSARQRVGAVLKGWMAGQLALTRGREAAEKAVDGMLDEFRAKLVASPSELAESLPFIYLVLQRAG